MESFQKRRFNYYILISIFLILSGVLIIGLYLYEIVLIKNNESKLLENFYKNSVISDVKEEKDDQEKEKSSNKKTQNNYTYVLKIPKINLEKGLYDVNNSFNRIDYNIEILKESRPPNILKSNFILVSHSGNSVNSYFRNLYKLKVKDFVYLHYQNIVYKYQVVNVYEVDKTGSIHILRNGNINCITLITCKHNSNKQIVVIGELISKTE